MTNGYNERLQELRSRPAYAAAVELKGVFGIGPVQAYVLIQRGFLSVAALRKQTAADAAAGEPLRTLTAAQLVGLRHYEDLQHRIPRDEVTAVDALVRHHAQLVAPGCQVHTVGSYRRGALNSGDVAPATQAAA